VYDIRDYITPSGKDVYLEWRRKLRDHQAGEALDRRLFRVRLGNFGDHKYLRDGVSELRINIGPGYRLYYAVDGDKIVLLLCGGDKSTQNSDIDRACAYWQDWQSRDEEANNDI
jgi:putative addiction module killer protein